MDHYPTGATRPAPPPAPAKGKVLTQVVLPLGIFVALVGGITFVTQYVPSWRAKPASGTAGPGAGGEVLTFPEKLARWDMHPGYGQEQELHTVGTYTFWFENRQPKPAELGLVSKSCQCSNVEACVLSADQTRAFREARQAHAVLQTAAAALPGPWGQGLLPDLVGLAAEGKDRHAGAGTGADVGALVGITPGWQELRVQKSGEPGQVVEPGQAGLVKLIWRTKRANDHLRLVAKLWTQAQGEPRTRQEVDLQALVSVVPAVRAYPTWVDIKRWDPAGVGRAEFRCFSATRTGFPLTAREVSGDPCVWTEVIPLTGTECRLLEKEVGIRAQMPMRVLSGYRVRVTVSQSRGDRQLEQGHFERWIKLQAPGGEIDDVRVTGFTRGDVTVGTEKDDGKINLSSFRRDLRKTQTVPVWTSPGVDLDPEKIEKKPDFMEVELRKVHGGDTDQATGWQLRVSIPPNPPVEGWPADSAIILHTRGKTAQRIRIPVNANPFR